MVPALVLRETVNASIVQSMTTATHVRLVTGSAQLLSQALANDAGRGGLKAPARPQRRFGVGYWGCAALAPIHNAAAP